MFDSTGFRIALATLGVLFFIAAGLLALVLFRQPSADREIATSSVATTQIAPEASAPRTPPPADGSLYKTGRALLRGDGVTADPQAALPYLARAAAAEGADAANAAFELGEAYRKGAFGVPADPRQAQIYLERAIEAGHGSAAITLGRALAFAEGLPADAPAGIALLEAQLAKPKSKGSAAYELGRFFLKGNKQVAADPERALAYLTEAVTAGNGRAAVLLGRSLLRGDGVPADAEAGKAVLVHEIETGKEAAAAAFELGSFYLKGNDAAPADPVIAGDYLARAIDAGHPDAALTLGRALLKGDGLPRDTAAGVELLELHLGKTKKPGATAMLLGEFFLKGAADMPADPAKARLYLDQAVAAGEKGASLVLGRALVRGDGLPADPTAGIALLESEIAADRNVASAAYELAQHYLRVARAREGETPEDSDTPPGEVEIDVYGYKTRTFSLTVATAGPSSAQLLARSYLERAHAAGHKDAAVVLGRALVRGDGLQQDVEAGTQLLERLTESGPNPGAAAFELGAFLLEKGSPDARPRGRAWLERAIAAGHARATTTLARWLLKQEKSEDRSYGIALLDGQIAEGKDISGAHLTLGTFYLGGPDANPKKARAHLDAAIGAGNLGALLPLGRALLSGKGVSKDAPAGAALLERAVAEGKSVGTAAAELGALYVKGRDGVAANAGKAKRYLEQAIAAGDKRAPTTLGRAILRGDLPGSASTAIAMLNAQIAAGRDVAAIANDLGQFYLKGGSGVPADPARAARYLAQASEAGQKDAGLSLGRSLLRSAKPGDRDAGARFLEQAADENPDRAPALYLDIGRAYLSVAPADPRRAKAALERAAALGNADALMELGRAAADGKFGANGGNAASAYYRQAIAAGAAAAYARLARLSIDGKGGLRKDIRGGIEILRQGVSAGNADAMRELMSIYLTGIGKQFPKDVRAARDVFAQYRRVAKPDDVALHALLIEAADSGGLFQSRDARFGQVLNLYRGLPEAKRAAAAQQLFRVNRDAVIFLAQSLLKSAGYFNGNVNGVYAPDIIDAIQKACRAGGEGQCGPKTLHGDTFGFIARNYS